MGTVQKGLIAAGLLAWVGVAHAGRPLVTEDAGVLGRGECEIETFLARERASEEPTVRGWSAQIGCGIGLSTQLALNATGSEADDERVRRFALTGKTSLRELTDEQAGVAIAYFFGAEKLPAASYKYETTSLTAVATLPVDKWLFHANLGWARSQSAGSDSTIWAVAAERTEVGPVDLAVESFGDDHSAAWIQVAARWAIVPERFFLDASYGVQASGARPTLLTIGAKFAF